MKGHHCPETLSNTLAKLRKLVQKNSILTQTIVFAHVQRYFKAHDLSFLLHG